MLKLVLWDYTGNSANWTKKFLRPNVAEIVRTLKPDDPDQAEVILRGDWDYVLIFADDNSQEIFDEMLSTMRAMNFSTDNVIFAMSIASWIENPVALYSLLEPSTTEIIYRRLNFENHRQWHHYVACSAEDLHYVGTSKDEFVIKSTYIKRENHTLDEMKTFHALAKKYYGTDDNARGGWFLDLGANIGTTGIYFLKKIAPNLKLFAVEPDAENFKLLRVNLILNDLESRATLINCGLGDKFEMLAIQRNLENPGGNGFIPSEYNTPAEKVQIAPLDYLLAENKIAPEEVKYIWIDTEGFEPKVLFGAKNLLTKNNVPVFMECTTWTWRKIGLLEKMVDMLSEIGYKNFISVQEFLLTGKEKIYPIENLLAELNPAKPLIYQMGDIFLIKNL